MALVEDVQFEFLTHSVRINEPWRNGPSEKAVHGLRRRPGSAHSKACSGMLKPHDLGSIVDHINAESGLSHQAGTGFRSGEASAKP